MKRGASPSPLRSKTMGKGKNVKYTKLPEEQPEEDKNDIGDDILSRILEPIARPRCGSK